MGGLISSQRYRPGSLSFRFYRPAKQERRRATHPTPKQKRDSAKRPVLQLQVTRESLDRQRRNRRGLPSGSSLGNLTRDSDIYDHLLPAAPAPPRRSTSTPALALHHTHRYFASDANAVGDSGRISMVMVQFVDNGSYNFTEEKDENDYDRLLPRGEFDHLCTCTYGREEKDGHLTTLNIGRGGSQVQQLETINHDELKDRLLQHVPPHYSTGYHDYSTSKLGLGRQRSQSVDATSGYRLEASVHRAQPARRLAQSTTNIDSDADWSLGESIMKTLSVTGLNLFNIDNPTHESEVEVNRLWPELREKLQRVKLSESMEEHDEAFVDSELPTVYVSNH